MQTCVSFVVWIALDSSVGGCDCEIGHVCVYMHRCGLEGVCPGEYACRGEGGWRILMFVSKDRCRICKEVTRKVDPTLCRESGSMGVRKLLWGQVGNKGKGYTRCMMK